MQQRRHDRLGVEFPAGAGLRDSNRVRDVGFAALAILAEVGLVAEVERRLDVLDLFRRQIAGKAEVSLAIETTSCRRGCSGVAVGPNRWRNDCSRTASMYLRAEAGESPSWASCSTSETGGEGLVLIFASVSGWTPVCTRVMNYMAIKSR